MMRERDYAYIASLAVGVILAASLTFYFLVGERYVHVPPCIIYTYTGLYCPACGGTRSVLALMRGDVLSALAYNPAVPYACVVYVAFVLVRAKEHLFPRGRRVPDRFWMGCIWLDLGILAGNMILRNVLKLGFGVVL